MRHLVLLLMLSACASPQRGEYRQSAAPMAPAFNPMTDALHTLGQPGYIGAPDSVPRSPHKRYLPPTKEPGLWAGDGARAVLPGLPPKRKHGDPIPPINILGISVPHHPTTTDGWETSPTEQCAGAVNRVLYGGDMALATRAMALTIKQRACLAALAQQDCMSAMIRDFNGLTPSFSPEDIRPYLMFALQAATRWVSETCPQSEPSKEVPAILHAMEIGNRPGGTTQ